MAAFVARFPSLLWPLRPDEAGFLLVARAWRPEADSVYGHYFVDRPPPIIWLMQATDAVGGAYTHRLVGAVGCALLVLAAAAAATRRSPAARASSTPPPYAGPPRGWRSRPPRWSATPRSTRWPPRASCSASPS